MQIIMRKIATYCFFVLVSTPSPSFLYSTAQETVDVVDDAEFPPSDHVWMAPSAEDVRSPCPFINTLANHNYIDRTGRNVNLTGMVDELVEKFDVKRTLFDKLASAAITMFNWTTTDANGTIRIDIDRLFEHNKQEHDASFVRADEYFGVAASRLVDPMLLDAFLNTTANTTATTISGTNTTLMNTTATNTTTTTTTTTNPVSYLTQADIMAYQTMRLRHSLANNPQVKLVAAQTTSFSAQATFWLVLGQTDDLSRVDTARLREFLTYERFPVGYVPRALLPSSSNSTTTTFVPHDVLENGTLASNIRLEFAANFASLLPPVPSTTTSAPATTPATTTSGGGGGMMIYGAALQLPCTVSSYFAAIMTILVVLVTVL